MESNKGQTIFFSVIGIATLLVAIVGATFAWFSTTLTGDPAKASVSTATISGVELSSTNITSEENVLPGWVSQQGEIEIGATSAITGDVEIAYTCTVNADNILGGALYYGISGDANTTMTWTKIDAASTPQEIVSGTLTAANQSDVYKVQLRFAEAGSDQNSEQTKVVNATFDCDLVGGGNVYYNDANPSGTTDQPSAETIQ